MRNVAVQQIKRKEIPVRAARIRIHYFAICSKLSKASSPNYSSTAYFHPTSLHSMRLPRIWLALVASTAAALSLGRVNAFPLGVFQSSQLQATEPDAGPDLDPQPHPHINTTKEEDHKYFRPAGKSVSGFPTDNKATYHRSPCPGLNSLANHGYLPRDGKNLTPQILVKAVMDVFNLDDRLAFIITHGLPATFTLADLSVHNFVEHDASMVHEDSYFGNDPSQADPTLIVRLLQRANKYDQLTANEIARWRHDREVECQATNPQYDFGPTRQAGAFAEVVAFLMIMGDTSTESISVDHALSFLMMEKMPKDFEKSTTLVTAVQAISLVGKLKVLAAQPWELLSVN